jgi:hypothetical protein
MRCAPGCERSFLECEVWVADNGGVIALLVLKDDWIDELYVDARSACASHQ